MTVDRLRGLWVQMALFAAGVGIGLVYVYVNRPDAAVETAVTPPATASVRPTPALSRAAPDTRQAIDPATDAAIASEGIDGPASMAFATSTQQAGIPEGSGIPAPAHALSSAPAPRSPD
jgi:hypothetical protein